MLSTGVIDLCPRTKTEKALALWSQGSRLGSHELVRKLGEGRGASVWLARTESAEGTCALTALKILKGPIDDRLEQALQREAMLLGRLRHPNIVGVLGVEVHKGSLMMNLEYLAGGTLRRLVNQVKTLGLVFPRAVVMSVCIDVLRALQHAHGFPGTGKRGVVHRDLKPENVLLDVTGRVKVADFGLAKVIGELSRTAPGMIKGTHRYVAPEIWRGVGAPGPVTDLFAVGCILFELITLRRLFDGSIRDSMELATTRTADEEAGWVAGVAPGLAPIVATLLRREPSRRYQCAGRVIEDLQVLRDNCGSVGDTGLFYDLIQRRLDGRGPASSDLRTHLASSKDSGWARLATLGMS